MNFGPFFFTDDVTGLHTLQHESGHGLQNALWGPLFLFLVALPSGLRYNLRTFKTYQTKTIFCNILFAVLFGLLIALLSVTFTCLPVHILLGLLLIYAVILCGWMFWIELPQYKDNKSVDYDAIWFEGQASR